MMLLFLSAGAKLAKAVTRVREVYHIPEYPDSELVIDTYHFAHETLEYAEVESPTERDLKKLLKDYFDLESDEFSDTGITSLHKKQEQSNISRRLGLLEEMLDN